MGASLSLPAQEKQDPDVWVRQRVGEEGKKYHKGRER